MLGIGEHARARRHEELRDLVVVHVLPHRRATRRAEAIEQKGDLLLLDQTPRLLDSLGRAIAVVETNQIDLATVHSTLLVDHFEIGEVRLADHAVSRRWAAIGHRLPDLDLGVGDARRIVRPGGTGGGGERRSGGARLQKCPSIDHGASPFPSYFTATLAPPFLTLSDANARTAARAAPATPVGIAAITRM